ncbi:MAG: polysaccharide biosynthesis tyrosine autokinase [Xenococcaceae cyanobacterium MO_207.B15]|nr:polysaccharide biosynthesis tyrosine autokinase [Xenococcaceae cyanobacterium MO_207.B15]
MIQSNNNWEEKELGADLGYGELLKILWRRRFWFLGVFAGVITLNTLISLQKPSIYMSSMQLLVEPNYQGNTDSQEEFSDYGVEIDYATQINLMRSSGLLKRAVTKLQAQYPDMTIEELRKSLEIYQLIEGKTETKIIEADYVGNSPTLTKEVLEKIKAVYLEYNLEQQEKRLQDGLSFINNQIPEARQDLIQTESSITELRNRYNLIDPEQEAAVISDRLGNIKQQRESLKAEYQDINGRYLNLQQQLGTSDNNLTTSTRLTQSERYQNLLNELQTVELELAQQRARFTEKNPIIQDLLAQRYSKQGLLRKEIIKVLGAVPPQLNLDLESLQKQGQLGESETDILETLTQLKAQLKGIEEKELSLAQTEQSLSKQLNEFPKIIAQYNSLIQEAEVKRNTLQRLLEAKQEFGIEIDRGGFNWQIVEPPSDGVLISPNIQRDLLLGIVVASVLGGFAAFVREASDNRVFDRKQIEQQVSLPVLGTIPREPLEKNNNHFLAQLPLSPSKSLRDILRWQPFQESVDIIYENLRLLNSYSAIKSLTVTSAIAQEGKSTLICGLAASIARRQQKVLIIDANLRSPRLHQEFELINRDGLSDWLAGGNKIPTIHSIPLLGETIDLIVAGSQTADPVKLLSNSRFPELIRNLEQHYDLVLVDTPPILGTVDAIKTASYCSGVVIVSRLDTVKIAEFTEATNLMTKFNLLGVVVNDSKEVRKERRQQFLLSQISNLN